MELTNHQKGNILRNTLFFKDELSKTEKNSQDVAFSEVESIVKNANTYDELITGIRGLIIEESDKDTIEILKQIRISNMVYRAYLYAVGVDAIENH